MRSILGPRFACSVLVAWLGLPGSAGAADEVVVLCPDIGESVGVFQTRDGGGGLAQSLLSAGYDVQLVDPWDGATARERGFDAVLEEVYPVLVDAVSVEGVSVIWVGRGLCGLLPVAAAAAGQDTEVSAWISLGTRFDFRYPAAAHLTWLRSWSAGESPDEDVARQTLLTGLAPGPRERRRGSTLDDVEALWRSRVARPPPRAVVDDLLRWFEGGRCARDTDDLDYLGGLEQIDHRALMIAAVTDPLAPPEDVIAGLDRAGGDVSYRMLSRVNGHGEEFGHVGMLLSRASRRGAQPVILAWLAGRGRLP